MGKHLSFSFISGNPFDRIICTPPTHPQKKSHKMISVLDIISIPRSLVLDFVAKHCVPGSMRDSMFLDVVFFSHSFLSKPWRVLDLLQLIIYPPGSLVQNYTCSYTRTDTRYMSAHTMQRSMGTFFQFAEAAVSGDKNQEFLCTVVAGVMEKNSYGHAWNKKNLYKRA